MKPDYGKWAQVLQVVAILAATYFLPLLIVFGLVALVPGASVHWPNDSVLETLVLAACLSIACWIIDLIGRYVGIQLAVWKFSTRTQRVAVQLTETLLVTILLVRLISPLWVAIVSALGLFLVGLFVDRKLPQ
ncbi:hypothetical protein QVA66_02930 [Staphylococcus chromogenes]|nr:hypothetical protein [Staphylococcus chromogenes]